MRDKITIDMLMPEGFEVINESDFLEWLGEFYVTALIQGCAVSLSLNGHTITVSKLGVDTTREPS
jgi:hypothetical protein